MGAKCDVRPCLWLAINLDACEDGIALFRLPSVMAPGKNTAPSGTTLKKPAMATGCNFFFSFFFVISSVALPVGRSGMLGDEWGRAPFCARTHTHTLLYTEPKQGGTTLLCILSVPQPFLFFLHSARVHRRQLGRLCRQSSQPSATRQPRNPSTMSCHPN
ncbi:hypothetical protein TW95_gp0514 [Pandoravirus inopinatum]|uniref:Uncharacterized protein n=1 Tax=Pandoravirus inopinatum TaxID=1605721 RepID=A0A0B5IX09_9VIRU|nr:hypothetical protein TW95_gp0514 [Pandoravirus inopinatum]AJF97248.1 hypothetical protein [Pandoravirus inopinatum]